MTKRATLTNAIENGIREKLKLVNTSIPGYVINFDANTQLAELQVAIERIDKEGNSTPWTPIISCPVQFPGGNEFILEYEINVGDEGIIIFSQRCIDSWVDQGGITPQSRIQFHDETDAYFIPGIKSQPNKITDFQNNGIRMRNQAGDNYIWLKNDNTAEIKVTTLIVDGNIQHTGTQTTTGSISATTSLSAPSVQAAGKELAGHTHPAGTPPGNTGPNN